MAADGRVPRRKPALTNGSSEPRLQNVSSDGPRAPEDVLPVASGVKRRVLFHKERDCAAFRPWTTCRDRGKCEFFSLPNNPEGGSDGDLILKQTWVIRQDRDPKHTSESTSEWL